MWDAAKRERYQVLRRLELEGGLTEAQKNELTRLTRELIDLEAAQLAPAMERLGQENAALEAEAERLSEQRRQLEELLGEKEAYIARVRTLVEELETERLDLLDRFVRIVGEPLRESDRTTAVSG